MVELVGLMEVDGLTTRVGLDKNDEVVPLKDAYRIIERVSKDDGTLERETIYIKDEAAGE